MSMIQYPPLLLSKFIFGKNTLITQFAQALDLVQQVVGSALFGRRFRSKEISLGQGQLLQLTIAVAHKVFEIRLGAKERKSIVRMDLIQLIEAE